MIWILRIYVDGYAMYQVLKKLKGLKKPLRKLLKDQGNLHNRVSILRNELDEVQKALDLDPFNAMFHDDEAAYLKGVNDAFLDEQRFLQQNAMVEWLREKAPNVFVAHYSQFLVTISETVPLDIPRLFLKSLDSYKADYMVCCYSKTKP
ncbi:hypothetical protein Tco_0303586 [Tanacetum coccineum]